MPDDARPTAETWFGADLGREHFRELGHRAIDMIADYLHDLPELPVYPVATGAGVAAMFDEPLPVDGQDPGRILDEWEQKVLPNTTHLGSPRYFGFVNGSGSTMAVLAKALAAAVNMNPGAWKPAPAATEVERRCIRWLAELIGYDPDCAGLITSGGTMANFTALTTALRFVGGTDLADDGLQGTDGRFRVYMADHEGHISIRRVVDLMGLGRESVRLIPSRDDFTMDVEALAGAIDDDSERGDVPFCVIAQVGSINVGAIDPLDAIADVCDERGLWFHADGASGAVGAMLPELRERYAGLERADSVTLDPHKWLYIPYECGSVLVRRPSAMRDAFSMTAPYLRGAEPTEYDGLDYLEYGPQMSRGFKALKLWMTLKHYGVSGYRRLLRQNIACARHMHDLVEASDDCEPAAAPELFLYSFRYIPPRLGGGTAGTAEYLDRLNQQIADQLQLSGEAFVMTSRIRGRLYLRLSICSHRTRLEDMDRVLSAVRSLGAQLDAENRPEP
jgi:aromatic-L-amino-acid decarboxylase